jgi:hypothetical protein
MSFMVNSKTGLKCREQRHTGGDVQKGREELHEHETHEGGAPKKTREVNK